MKVFTLRSRYESKRFHGQFRQDGATLIEVMITALVVAVGLLGLAALQIFAVQSSQQAYHRSQATVLAYEIGDWIRAHRSDVLDGGANQQAVIGLGTDDAYWHQVVADRLPNGTVTLDSWAAATGEVQITIAWSDDRNIEAESTDFDGAEQVQFLTRF